MEEEVDENHYGSSQHLIPVEEDSKQKAVSLTQLTSSFDRCLLLFGSIIAIGAGIGKPLFASLTGHVTKSFINFTTEIGQLNASDPRRMELFNEFHSQVGHFCLLYFLLAIWSFSTGGIQSFCFTLAGENLVNRLRKKFIKAIIRQDIGWFDTKKTGSLATELFSHLDRVKEGTGRNVGLVVQQFSMFSSGLIVCVFYSWKLSLIGLSLTPIITIWGIYITRLVQQMAKKQEDKNSEAGAIAEQTLSSIRTVMVFNGQEIECQRYGSVLEQMRNIGIRQSRIAGIWMFVSHSLLNISYFLTVWFGTNMLLEGTIEVNTLITVFLTILLVVMDLDVIAPLISHITKARAAAGPLYEVLDRVPEIDAYSKLGQQPPIAGRIEIRNLGFFYPTRPDVQVLRDVSLTIEPGQTVALVGASGSGKSSIVQLLLRNYIPQMGIITIDGVQIEKINVEYLRKQVGVVSQEPALFNTTIEENIRYGKENITEDAIWRALKRANAFDFVKAFPEGLRTLVGDRGAQLSGGQKQRIAIARALVRDPKILLLDEATSALDAQSEAIVQQALENASEGRTTLVIAHRLSTIRNANKIIAMKQGEIVETGTHDELMAKKGHYYELVNNQVFVEPVEPPSRAPHFRFSRSISSEIPGSPMELRRMFSAIAESIPEEVAPNDEDVALKRLKAELAEEDVKEVSYWRILKEIQPEWRIFLFCLIICCTEGIFFPGFSFGFTILIKIFSGTDKEEIRFMGHAFAVFYIVIGVYFGICQYLHVSLFGVIAERLAFRLRSKAYRNILRQDAAYFDKSSRSTGRLLTRLATDTNNIKPALNSRLGITFMLCSTDIIAYSLAFYFGWQMAVVAIPIFTPCFIAFALQSRFLRKRILREEKEMEACGKIAMEAIANIRTVQALNLQQKIHEKFCKRLAIPIRSGKEKAVVLSIGYGITQAVHFFLYSITFRAGLYLIYHEYLEPTAMLRSMFMVTFTSFGLGALTVFFPELVKAKMAAALLFKMVDEEPKIDGLAKTGTKPDLHGNVTIKNLHFQYPEREEVTVLKGIDLQVKEGETVALVGPSGCGKSTVVSLLERMYDPVEGTIEIDGFNIAAMNPNHLRSNISIVSQEPILFDMSIKENILYGLPESSVSHSEMIEAAKRANIHDFVASLPEAYQTRVGDKGTQLSGGQKQRIAIARALVRRPRILILDEATSALDTESEKHVQEALEEAGRGRSCLVVAHRLSTIRNASQIVVFKEGKVAERGSHEDLMNQRGVYFQLVQKQSN